MFTFASCLPGENQSQTSYPLSYSEACLYGRTDLIDILPYPNTLHGSKLADYKIKVSPTQEYDSSSKAQAKEGNADFFANGFETRVLVQVQPRLSMQIYFKIILTNHICRQFCPWAAMMPWLISR